MSTINELAASARKAVADKNWHAALAVAMTLPDICAYCTTGRRVRRDDYAQWFETWVGDKYVVPAGPNGEPDKSLTGLDAYALRCAFLHQGLDDLSAHEVRETIDSVMFAAYEEGDRGAHNNSIIYAGHTVLQLRIDKFCEDICSGVDAWLDSAQKSAEIVARANSLLKVHSVKLGQSMQIFADGRIEWR